MWAAMGPIVVCRSPPASQAAVGSARPGRQPRPVSCRKEPAPMALVPLNLLVSHDGKSKRQHVTCRYKCGDACSKPVPNTSNNEYFGDIAKAVSRRSVLQASGIHIVAGARRAAARHEVHRRRTEQRGRRRHPRRLRAGGGNRLGRPDPAQRAEVRRQSADRRRAAWPVRLQQRLRRTTADRGPDQPLLTGHQPRVRRPPPASSSTSRSPPSACTSWRSSARPGAACGR
jgi:hypothetical protein